MATEQSANLALPYLAAAQAQKHVTHNEAVRRLDAYVQLALESTTASEPPAAPAEGARWFVPAGATGDFAGQEGKLAAYEAGAFDFLAVPTDTLAFMRDARRFARFNGSTWVPLAADGGGRMVLESLTVSTPPAAPEDGARWFVPVGASGAFAGQAGSIATYGSGAFVFEEAAVGTLAFVRDQWRLLLFDGGAWVSPLAVRPTRSAIEAEVLEEELVLSGATVDSSVTIPARAIVLGVSTRTVSGVTGAASYDCGIAGEASKFGGSLGVALGSSNSGVIGPTAFYAPTPVRLSANGGVFTGGRVRVSIHILMCPVSAFPDLEAEWWTGEAYLLDAVEPDLAADFARERYALNGTPSSSIDVLQRSGGTKRVATPSGAWVEAPANVLAFDYVNGRRRLLLEGTSTNLFVGSSAPSSAQAITVTAQSYTVSFEGTGTLALSGAHSHTVSGTGASGRVSYSFTPAAGTLTLTPTGDVRKVQLEALAAATSYIETTTAAVTRVADSCQWTAGAAALLSLGGPVTLVWRGTVCTAFSAQQIIALTGGALLRSYSGSPYAGLSLYGASTQRTLASSAIPGDVSVCFGWDSSGRIGSVNEASPLTDTVAMTYAMDDVSLGPIAGLQAGARHEIDELLIWPALGSSTAVQQQARPWA